MNAIVRTTQSRSADTRRRHRAAHHVVPALIVAAWCTAAGPTSATEPPLQGASALKAMSLEELFSIEVTSVSREAEPLSQAASAIQVITGEEIRRSGASSLPEALRLAANLEVAQVNAHDWAITARGFNGAPLSNNSLADKLLVLIDGRSVYTPLFGGVFWDVQDLVLEDVDRIEVISGPGATLWGANAVNGVINVVTKKAKQTQGIYVAGAAGSFIQDQASLRWGGGSDSTFFFRVYGQRRDIGSTELVSGADAPDEWDITQGGFRVDYDASLASSLTVSGDVYLGHEGDPEAAVVEGENLLSRWVRSFSPESDLTAQVYFDRTWRDLPIAHFREELITVDADVQHRFRLGSRQTIVWGGGYRLMMDDVDNSVTASFDPEDRTMRLYGAFVQDAVALVGESLKIIVGTKLGHNTFSGMELQPSARLSWSPRETHSAWAAVSRAVRSPSRFDTDIVTPNLGGDPDFDSEEVVAYELGYRVRPERRLLCSVAAFHNRYDDIRSVNLNTTPPPLLTFANDQEAQTRGFEVTATVEVADWWRIRGGYSYLHEHFSPKSDLVVPGSDSFEATDPRYRIQFHTTVDLPAHLELDVLGRYVDALTSTVLTLSVPGYFGCDAKLAYEHRGVELAVIGRNLWEERHAEFGTQIPRSVRGQISFRL